jgi:hypothetical protein
VDVDVAAEAGYARVAVRGRPDAFGSWARQGRRVARFVARLLERIGADVDDGTATVMVRGRRSRLRITGETLEALLPGPSRVSRPSDARDAPAEGWDDLTIAEGIGPGQPSVPGWTVRRDPEPRAWADGMVAPDLLVRPAGQGRDLAAGALVCLVQTPARAGRLAGLLPSMRGGEPILFAGPGVLVEPLREVGGWTVELDRPALAPMVAVVAARALADGPTRVEEPPAARRRRRVA